MHIEEIARYLRDGELVRRRIWSKGVWIGICNPSGWERIQVRYFLKQNSKGQRIPYVMTAEDFLASDWELLR